MVGANRTITVRCPHGVTAPGRLDFGTLAGRLADHAEHYRAAFRAHEDALRCGCALPRIVAYGGTEREGYDEAVERRQWRWNDGRDAGGAVRDLPRVTATTVEGVQPRIAGEYAEASVVIEGEWEER